MLALWLGLLDADFDVIDAPELTDHLDKLGRPLPPRRPRHLTANLAVWATYSRL